MKIYAGYWEELTPVSGFRIQQDAAGVPAVVVLSFSFNCLEKNIFLQISTTDNTDL